MGVCDKLPDETTAALHRCALFGASADSAAAAAAYMAASAGRGAALAALPPTGAAGVLLAVLSRSCTGTPAALSASPAAIRSQDGARMSGWDFQDEPTVSGRDWKPALASRSRLRMTCLARPQSLFRQRLTLCDSVHCSGLQCLSALSVEPQSGAQHAEHVGLASRPKITAIGGSGHSQGIETLVWRECGTLGE